MNMSHFQDIYQCIRESEQHGLYKQLEGLSGFSGNTLIGTLQRVAKYQEDHQHGSYLEIGVFQGLTLISVAGILQTVPAYGIDNFAQFDLKGENKSIILQRMKLNNITNAHLINKDYEDALEDFKREYPDQKIGLYFIDGPHDYRSQLICLLMAKDLLSDQAVIIVDDCNYRHVRLANRDFLASHPEYKLLYEAYTSSHPGNMSPQEEKKARKGWWNGVNILVRDPMNLLQPMFPTTIRDRLLYENDHNTHTNKYGALAPIATMMAESLLDVQPLKFLSRMLHMFQTRRSLPRHLVGTHSMINTFSDKLTTGQANPSIEM